MPRVAYLLTCLAGGIAAALWLGAPGRSALTVAHAAAVMASAAVAALTTAMGSLIVSDWQADVQSRQDWMQLGLTPAELHAPVDIQAAWDLDPSYQALTNNEALWQVLRADRSSLPLWNDSMPAVATKRSAPSIAPDHVSHTGERSRDRPRHHALRAGGDVGNGGVLRLARRHRVTRFHVKHTALAGRLVANGPCWRQWAAHDVNTPQRVLLSAGSTGKIVTLSSREDGQLPRPSEISRPTDLASEAPSCRGPPSANRTRSCRRKVTTAVQLPVNTEAVLPAAVRETDPVVRDDLGRPIPVCAAELEAIEVYLGHVLSELLEEPEISGRGAVDAARRRG